jgi:hypothetical protein
VRRLPAAEAAKRIFDRTQPYELPVVIRIDALVSISADNPQIRGRSPKVCSSVTRGGPMDS